MENELLDWVDDSDTVIGVKSRQEIYEHKLTNRICHVMVVNKKGQIALQKRSLSVGFMPGAWSSSAGGHVGSGESYEQGAAKELQEEIGITGKLRFIDKILYINKTNNHLKFLGIFELIYEGDFKYEDGEVDYIEWVANTDIKKMIESGESFHPELLHILEKYYF